MISGASEGAAFVLLDNALTRLPTTLAEIGLNYWWRYGPANRDIGDASYETTTHAVVGLGLRPYSPVHVRGQRDQDGNLSITWTRRTRSGGDSWEVSEVPLSEDSEAYEVEVLDAGMVKRVLTTTAATVTYSAIDQISDFGALRSTCDVRVHQMSAVIGRGAGRNATV